MSLIHHLPRLVRVGVPVLPTLRRPLAASPRRSSTWRLPVLPPVTPVHVLLGLNVSVFALVYAYGDSSYALRRFIARNMILSNRALNEGRVWTLFTSACMHADLAHLAFNSLALYTFGSSAHAMLGTKRFLGLYAAGALTASLTQSWWNARLRRYSTGTVGASGAIAAVSVWVCARVPTGSVYLYGIIPVPNLVFVAGFVGLSAWSMVGQVRGGGGGSVGSEYAHAGHLGGALTGLAYYFAARKGIMR